LTVASLACWLAAAAAPPPCLTLVVAASAFTPMISCFISAFSSS
jgi:hypothetical protein